MVVEAALAQRLEADTAQQAAVALRGGMFQSKCQIQQTVRAADSCAACVVQACSRLDDEKENEGEALPSSPPVTEPDRSRLSLLGEYSCIELVWQAVQTTPPFAKPAILTKMRTEGRRTGPDLNTN